MHLIIFHITYKSKWMLLSDSSSAQISLTTYQIKCFLTFKLCNCCCYQPKGTWVCVCVCHGLMAVSLLCVDHWTLTLLVLVTVQHVARKKPRRLLRLTLTCAWPQSLTLECIMRKYCFQSRRDIVQLFLSSSESSAFCTVLETCS